MRKRWGGVTKSPDEIAEAKRQTRERKAEEKKRELEHAAEYRETIKKGYKPNRETLLAQIEGQYTDGLITKQEYDWGIKGLKLVYGYVAAAKALTADEEGMAEFGF